MVLKLQTIEVDDCCYFLIRLEQICCMRMLETLLITETFKIISYGFISNQAHLNRFHTSITRPTFFAILEHLNQEIAKNFVAFRNILPRF